MRAFPTFGKCFFFILREMPDEYYDDRRCDE